MDSIGRVRGEALSPPGGQGKQGRQLDIRSSEKLVEAIRSLFNNARRLHPGPLRPEDLNKSHIERFGLLGRLFVGIGEAYADPHALELLEDVIMSQITTLIDEARSDMWLFAMELPKKRSQAPLRYASRQVVLEISQLLRIPVVDPIRSPTDWEVIKETIQQGKEGGEFTGVDATGFYVGSLAHQLFGRDIHEASRRIASTWKMNEQQLVQAYQEFNSQSDEDQWRKGIVINGLANQISHRRTKESLRQSLERYPKAQKILMVARYIHVDMMKMAATTEISSMESSL